MKKQIAVYLSLIMLFTLTFTGCNKTGNNSPSPSSEPENVTTTLAPQDLSAAKPIRYEAEKAELSDGLAVAKDANGYSGDGYVCLKETEEAPKDEETTTTTADTLVPPKSYPLTFNVKVDSEGEYLLTLRYNATAYASITIKANEEEALESYLMRSSDLKPEYDDENAWDNSTAKLKLTSGENKIVIACNDNSNEQTSPKIDYITCEKLVPEGLLTSFKFTKEKNPELDNDLAASISQTGHIDASVPYTTDLTKLVATIETTGSSAEANEVVFEGGTTDFTAPVFYTITDADGEHKYVASIRRMEDTAMPMLYLNLDKENPDAEDYIKAKNRLQNDKTAKTRKVDFTATLSLNSQSKLSSQSNIWDAQSDIINTFNNISGKVHLRGNSTLDAPKKGYKIKFQEKQNVLDMPANKHWVLIPNNTDKSLLRNVLGFEIGRAFDKLEYTPRARAVHLCLDGEYWGVYLLCEQIRQGKDRVNIVEQSAEEDGTETTTTTTISETTGETKELSDADYYTQPETTTYEEKHSPDGADVSGGYLMQINRRAGEDMSLMNIQSAFPLPFRMSDGGMDNNFIQIEEPREGNVTAEQYKYITTYMYDFINTLDMDCKSGFATQKYKDFIDVDTFVDWYVCNEIMKTLDSDAYASVFFYKDAGADSKLKMGPVWDFDISSGNSNYFRNNEIVEEFWNQGYMWFEELLHDPEFAAAVKARYEQKLPDVQKIIGEYLNNAETYYTPAANDNFTRWDILSTYVWPQPVIYPTYKEYVQSLREWLPKRLEWLSAQPTWGFTD